MPDGLSEQKLAPPEWTPEPSLGSSTLHTLAVTVKVIPLRTICQPVVPETLSGRPFDCTVATIVEFVADE